MYIKYLNIHFPPIDIPIDMSMHNVQINVHLIDFMQSKQVFLLKTLVNINKQNNSENQQHFRL